MLTTILRHSATSVRSSLMMVSRRSQHGFSSVYAFNLAAFQVPLVQFNSCIRSMSTKRSTKVNSLSKTKGGEPDYEAFLRNEKPDFSPLPVLSKSDIAKITTTEVGSVNLNISERDLLEIDALSSQLFEMLTMPFSEDVLVDIKEMNVDKLVNKVKDTLHVDNVPATIKAMRVLSVQDRVDDALFLWKVLQQNPKQCTLFAWTAYFSVLCNHGKAEMARETIKDMVLSGVKPDEYIYGTIVNGLVKEGKLDEAYGVSREMMKAGMRPNNVVFSSLIYGCIKKHQLARANETFDLMRNYIEEPDAITLALMIKVSEMQHNTERAIALFDSMSLHQQTPTAGCYLAIMHACARSWRYDVMTFDFYTKMLNAGFSPSLPAYHILLESCIQHGDFVRANNVLIELQDQGFKPTSQTMTLVLKVLAASIDGDLAFPEHPAGNRRFTRKEYAYWKQGVPVAREKHRLDYVRELRTRNIDDGLGPDVIEEEEEPETEETVMSPSMLMTQQEEKKENPEELSKGLLKKISESQITGTGRTRGLTEKELTETIEEKPVEESLPMDIRTAVEKVVKERYSADKVANDVAGGVLKNALNKTISDKKDIKRIPLDSLSVLEQDTRKKLESLYEAKGGDLKHIDYTSSLWRECVNSVLQEDSSLMKDMRAMVRQKFGLTSLIGAEMLETKEKADEQFKKEVEFLRSCYEGDESHAHKLTQLRIAGEIDESILKQYDMLSKAEPNMIYRRVGSYSSIHS